jgi:hypothetical protein
VHTLFGSFLPPAPPSPLSPHPLIFIFITVLHVRNEKVKYQQKS